MKTNNIPQVTVLIPSHVTAAQFGIDQKTFDKHVRGQHLPIAHTVEAETEGSTDFTYVLVSDDPEPFGIATKDLIARPFPCCEVPKQLHGQYCGWKHAAMPQNPLTEEERDWKRMWEEANPGQHSADQDAILLNVESHAGAEVLQ